MLRPPAFTVTMLPWLNPSRRIVGTDISNALSHVIFVTGSGSSCNQPLLAKQPSNTRASFMKHNSTLASRLEGCASASVLTARAMSLAREETFTLVIGLPAIIPVSSHVRHADSNVEPARPLMVMCVRRTIAYPSCGCESPIDIINIMPSDSMALCPPCAGSLMGCISGCCTETVPSGARTSPQLSKKCDCGTWNVHAESMLVSSR